jgi:hypothetical protein
MSIDPTTSQEKRELPAPRAAARGVWLALKWYTYVLGPLATMLLLFGAGNAIYELAAGRRIAGRSLAILLAPFALYLAGIPHCILFGSVLGVVFNATPRPLSRSLRFNLRFALFGLIPYVAIVSVVLSFGGDASGAKTVFLIAFTLACAMALYLVRVGMRQ